MNNLRIGAWNKKNHEILLPFELEKQGIYFSTNNSKFYKHAGMYMHTLNDLIPVVMDNDNQVICLLSDVQTVLNMIYRNPFYIGTTL